LSIRPAFSARTSGTNRFGESVEGRFELADLTIVYSHYDLAYWDPFEISGAFRYTLPVSRFSQATGGLGRLRGDLFLTYKMGRFSAVGYVLKAEWYFQRQRAFVDPTTPTNSEGEYRFDPRKTNRFAALEHGLEANLDLGRRYGLQTSLLFSDDWTYSSEAEQLAGRRSTFLKSRLALDWRPLRMVNFSVAVENRAALNNLREDVIWGHPKDNTYSLSTNVYF
ncbi:MAG: hypothetical protein N2578_09600, partial [Bdellovibrionaceae bacterium]|nr:hypothetical protein [Pseudobdellovibrionaceae bacterium]